MRRLPAFAALLMVGAYSSCDPELLGDPSFDIWCGDALCEWTLEEGEIERVATWHPEDHGASLIGEPVVLSQLSDATHSEVDCIRFELVADVESDASLTLELDFLDDGVIEYEHPLVSDDYALVSYVINPPSWFEGVRFRVKKVGEGRAVMAQLGRSR